MARHAFPLPSCARTFTSIDLIPTITSTGSVQPLPSGIISNTAPTCKKHVQNVQGDAGGIMFLAYVPGKKKREDWCMPTGPWGSSQPDGSREVQELWRKSFFVYSLLAAYSSRVVMTGIGCIFQEPDSSAVGVFPQNSRNFPFDTLRLEGPGISILWGYKWKGEVKFPAKHLYSYAFG